MFFTESGIDANFREGMSSMKKNKNPNLRSCFNCKYGISIEQCIGCDSGFTHKRDRRHWEPKEKNKDIVKISGWLDGY